jgi:Xaa-Pro aminopeptidase
MEIPKAETTDRIARLQSRLADEKLDGALILYPLDMYYFSGTRQNGALWIPAEGDPILFVRKSYTRACTESRIADTRPFPPSHQLTALIGANTKRIGMTFDVLPVQYYVFYSNNLPGREFVDISSAIRELRSVKSPWEQHILRDNGRKLSEVIAQIPSFFVPGMREIDLAAELECRLRKAGSEIRISTRSFGMDMVGLVTSGVRGTVPGGFDGPATGAGLSPACPFGPSADPIPENVPILIDYAGIWNGYVVDITRVFVHGTLDAELSRACRVASEIELSIASRLRPGAICEDLYAHALAMAEEARLASNYMGYPGEQSRFVGHGVGLELDELPILAKGFKTQLKEGQVIALEPKFVFLDKGVVGIENTWLVTPNGADRLTTLSDEVLSV